MTALPLFAETPEDSADRRPPPALHPLAWRHGRPVPPRRFLAEVERLAAALPPGQHLLNLCGDRYRFAVAFCAAVLAGRISLLPPNHSAELIARLQRLYGDVFAICDDATVAPAGTRLFRYPAGIDDTANGGDAANGSAANDSDTAGNDAPLGAGAIPRIAAGAVVAHVFTSGSTGLPTAHRKTWGRLVHNVQSEALALGLTPGSATTLVATVPPQHMYGFESSVLLALHNRIAFSGASPFYPADVVATLAAVPGERVLVTTPFHLRTLLAAELPLPPVRLVLCATAPLAPELARAAEQRFGAPLLEIYGCTEAGQLATRRPVADERWQTMRGVRITQRRSADGAEQWIADGGHVEVPTPLSDLLELESPQRFRLLGRGADMVNVAGKRTSLAHLNQLLCGLPGVADGAFFNPEPAVGRDVERLIAFFVSATLSERDVLAALRERTDPVFLPRPLHRVERLPRSASGKLPQAALAELAMRLATERAARRRR
ncbi:MAG: AMP-binding protein [Lautropia sp.]